MTLSLCIPDDVNVSAIIAAVVVVFLIISICGLGAYYAYRQGYFNSECLRLWLSPLPSLFLADFIDIGNSAEGIFVFEIEVALIIILCDTPA